MQLRSSRCKIMPKYAVSFKKDKNEAKVKSGAALSGPWNLVKKYFQEKKKKKVPIGSNTTKGPMFCFPVNLVVFETKLVLCLKSEIRINRRSEAVHLQFRLCHRWRSIHLLNSWASATTWSTTHCHHQAYHLLACHHHRQLGRPSSWWDSPRPPALSAWPQNSSFSASWFLSNQSRVSCTADSIFSLSPPSNLSFSFSSFRVLRMVKQ